MKRVGVAILGLGTVGGGTYKILAEHREYYQKTQDIDLVVESVLEPDVSKIRALEIDQAIVAKNIAEVVCNPDVNIVVECIGGTTVAREYVLDALYVGKTVVTSNKQLYASYSEELERVAKQHNAGLHLSASCMGGVPIVGTLLSSLQANIITSLIGIVNGTTNHILSMMAQENVSYEEALSEVQALGIVEADSGQDVDGYDPVYKLSILASLAFHTKIPVEKIYREGISSVTRELIADARELGYCVKLLAIGKQSDEGIEVRVHPALVPNEHQLATISGSFNAMFLTGDSVGEIMLYGRGAGALPSGSAIVSDIIYATNHYGNDISSAFKNGSDVKRPKIITDFRSAYFMRLEVKDLQSAPAKINSILAKKGISVRKMCEIETDGKAFLILVTRETRESIMRSAEKKLSESDIAQVAMTVRVIS